MSFKINITANQMAAKQREAKETACQEWLDASMREIFKELGLTSSQYTMTVPLAFRDQLNSMASALEQVGYGVDTEFEDRITISW